MKKNKFNALAFVAMLATAGAAYAFAPVTTKAGANENEWARDQHGHWQNLTLLNMEGADCQLADETCKVYYEVNTAPINGLPGEPGYLRESTEKGFVEIP